MRHDGADDAALGGTHARAGLGGVGVIRAFLLDDEELATRRLSRLLEETGQVEIAGVANDPVAALTAVAQTRFDVLFLDIEMPELTGFEFLARLHGQDPLVVFTTAFNEYALRAFEVNSIDYLVKPVSADALARALRKVERVLGGQAPREPLQALVAQLSAALQQKTVDYPARISSKIGDKVEFIELARVTHFYAEEKLTFAAVGAKSYIIDATIAELEVRLDPRRFVRVHRSTMVNVDYVQEMFSYFGGKMLVRLKDEKKTEVTVARERVKELREKMGI
jgi:two-component system, LytTR family, response regulator